MVWMKAKRSHSITFLSIHLKKINNFPLKISSIPKDILKINLFIDTKMKGEIFNDIFL